MSKIRVLPQILANKIAAGEIVERPASVAKELMENSIDAGSRSITIAIEAGGKRLISVRDDGEGMSHDDAILAFEHHATSKITTADDLGAIATLGFRGEALPSIASVSRLSLRTRLQVSTESVAGTEVEIQGGTVRSVKPLAWDQGTEVVVRDLFFNVPARRKFLRSHETELAHITRLVTSYALAHPEIRFMLQSGGRHLIDVVPVETLRERAYQLFGEQFLENLVALQGASGSMRLQGLCSLPHEQRTNPHSQFFFVNRRMVRDKVIMSAVRQAYRNCMPASAYPVVLLFLSLPHDEVDVNAHPAKVEVRFRQQSAVFELVKSSIEKAIVGIRSVPSYQRREPLPAGLRELSSAENSLPGPLPDTAESLRLFAPSPGSDAFQRAFRYPFEKITDAPLPATGESNHSRMRLRADMLIDAPEAANAAVHLDAVRILGQYRDSYIIAGDSEGLLIVDQHVAHERILYEKYARALIKGTVEAQGLLVPITLELPPHQTVTLERVLPELNRSGFSAERFGGRSVIVRSVPAVAGDVDCGRLLLELLEGLEQEDRTLDVGRIRDRIAVGTACRSAIKVNMPLTPEKMRWLLDELSRTRIPTNCPHGRPIMLRFGLYEIERNFGRA